MLLFKNKSVLLAEDDNIVRANLTGILTMLFSKVYTASNAEDAYRLYQDKSPNVIITSIIMPKKDEISFIEQIRCYDYDIPIVLLVNSDEQELLIHTADLSVEGYLIKPVEPEKLSYLLCKAIQRTHKSVELISLGKELSYNSATKELYKSGTAVMLGLKEQKLIQLLIDNRHKTVTKEEIEKVLWKLNPTCNSAIKNIILRVRKKLGLNLIVSVRGIGYRLNI